MRRTFRAFLEWIYVRGIEISTSGGETVVEYDIKSGTLTPFRVAFEARLAF